MENHKVDLIKVVLVDDHLLFRKGIYELISNFEGFRVIYEASNGRELVEKLPAFPELPDIILLDINMKVMNGYETMQWIHEHYPDIKVLTLSMYDDEMAIIRMLRLGAAGYLLKDTEPRELKDALTSTIEKGYYHSELVSRILVGRLTNSEVEMLNEREVEFLQLACSEMTYKEIADKMCVSPRTIDGYRESLFQKLEIKSRVGLVIYAIKQGVFKID